MQRQERIHAAAAIEARNLIVAAVPWNRITYAHGLVSFHFSPSAMRERTGSIWDGTLSLVSF
jgi:hypothetical protein